MTKLQRNWRLVSLLLAVIGISISLYALNHHLQIKIFGRTNAMCNLNDLFNCDRVAKSQFSEILGFPLGVLGLAYFLTVLMVLLWGQSLILYGGLVIAGFTTSVMLAGISAFGVRALCIMCMSIYAINLFQTFGLFVYTRKIGPVFQGKWKKGFLLSLCTLGLTLFTFKQYETEVMNLLKEPAGYSKVRHFLIGVFRMKPLEIPLYLKGENYTKDIWIGNPQAKVTLVEFIDHMCPGCQGFGPHIEKAREEFGQDLLVVLKQSPLSVTCNPRFTHRKGRPFACESAYLALCLDKKGKYWTYQKSLFQLANSSSSISSEPHYVTAGKTQGLSAKEIKECEENPEVLRKVHADLALAESLNIFSTPSIFINGWRFSDSNSYEFLRHEIKYQLEQVSKVQ